MDIPTISPIPSPALPNRIPVHISVAYVKQRLSEADSDSGIALLLSDLINYSLFEIIFKQNVEDFTNAETKI